MQEGGKNEVRQHTLRRLNSQKIRKRTFIGFDVETHGQKNTFLMGSFYWYDAKDRPCIKQCRKRNCLIQFMLDHVKFFRSRWIIATNLEFDFTVLFKGTQYWNCFDLLFRDSQLISVTERKEDDGIKRTKGKWGKIQFVDTMNYAPYSVAKWGKILGKSKLEPPSSWERTTIQGYDTIVPRKPKTKLEWLELNNYNQRDCEVSCDAMYMFQKAVNMYGGELKITIASSCFEIFRRRFLNKTLVKETYVLNDPKVNDLIYDSYYGGRTEVFKRGEFTDLYYYDINSLYPSAMLEAVPLPQSVKRPSTPQLKNIISYEGVSKCNITAPKTLDAQKPFLAYRDNGKLIFPTGTFTGSFTHLELRYAIELGYSINTIYEQIYYTETIQLFNQYITTMYENRLQQKRNNDPLESMTKLFMNSLYGGFGMKRVTETKLYDMRDMTTSDLKELGEYEMFGDFALQTTEKEYNGKRKFPIIATYITAQARCIMYPYINHEEIVYTDTDSIFTTEPIPDDLISDKLGYMKLEGKYDHGIFIKPKMYAVTDDEDCTTVKLKGVSRPTYDEFLGTVKGGEISKLKFCRLRESIRRGLDTNEVIPITKFMDLEDTKRVWDSTDILGTVVDSVPIEVTEQW